MTTTMSLVAFHDKELITTSSIVAKIFGKQHGHVLREIEKIIQKCELLENHHSIFGVMVDDELERTSAFEFNGESTKLENLEERLRKIAESSGDHQLNFQLMVQQPEERRREFGEGEFA